MRHMMNHGVGSVVVIDQSPVRARQLAEKLGGTAASLADRWKCMVNADIVVAATGCLALCCLARRPSALRRSETG